VSNGSPSVAAARAPVGGTAIRRPQASWFGSQGVRKQLISPNQCCTRPPVSGRLVVLEDCRT
jgi:hypothetical protein